MSDFAQTTWKDICTLEYGKSIKDYKNEDNEFLVYGSAGKIGTHSEYHLNEGVIVSRKGTLDVYYSETPFFVIDTAFYLNPKPGLNSKWAYYALKNFDIKILISGTGVPSLSRNEFYSQKLFLPKINYQERVSLFLTQFDKKIELNHKMNETLKEIAKTLFKSWFIDFDPVREKLEGKFKGLSKEISNLFPNFFEESELGEIPKGWKLGSLGDIILRSKQRIGKIDAKVLAAVSSGELILSEEYFSKRVFSKNIDKYLKVEKYDFAYNPSRINIGSIGMNKNSFIGAVSPVYIAFKTKKYWHWFVEQFLRLESTNTKIKQLSSGSVRQSLSFEDFASISITIPDETTLLQFNKIYELLRTKIIQNENECKILNSLINTLLPKLISGELRISDVEKSVQEAGV